VAAVRRFKRSVITPLEWKKVTMDVDGRKYPIFFRDAIVAAQEMVMQVKMGDLCWGEEVQATMDAGTDDPQSMLLRGVRDGEMYRQQRAHVESTMKEGTRVLAMDLYSDATVLSSSGAVSAYPLRMRVANIETEEVRWATLLYIPQVESKFLETRKGQEVRSELLQRILHLVFRRNVLASHRGGWLSHPVAAEYEFPRVRLCTFVTSLRSAQLCASRPLVASTRVPPVWLLGRTRAQKEGPVRQVETSKRL